jgi:hypothetical protein
VALFDGAPFRWWVAGGHALELHLGRSWRNHDDLDIGICRQDMDEAIAWLEGWDCRVGLNNVWGRRSPVGPWQLDLTVGEGSEELWVYRRDTGVTRPWKTAVLSDPVGIPYLAPDIQLLFKSKSPRPKDDQDAARVIPELGRSELEFLAETLPGSHPWREIIERRAEKLDGGTAPVAQGGSGPVT